MYIHGILCDERQKIPILCYFLLTSDTTCTTTTYRVITYPTNIVYLWLAARLRHERRLLNRPPTSALE